MNIATVRAIRSEFEYGTKAAGPLDVPFVARVDRDADEFSSGLGGTQQDRRLEDKMIAFGLRHPHLAPESGRIEAHPALPVAQPPAHRPAYEEVAKGDGCRAQARHGAPLARAVAKHQRVRVPPSGIEKRRNIRRVMLPIGVECQHGLRATGNGAIEPLCEPDPLAPVGGVLDDLYPQALEFSYCSVGRTVADDEDAVDVSECPFDDRADRCFLIIGRDEYGADRIRRAVPLHQRSAPCHHGSPGAHRPPPRPALTTHRRFASSPGICSVVPPPVRPFTASRGGAHGMHPGPWPRKRSCDEARAFAKVASYRAVVGKSLPLVKDGCPV